MHFNIAGTKVTVTNLAQACRTIEGWIHSKYSTYVCISPAATIVDGSKSKEYQQVINNAGMNTPDGMPLVWFGKCTPKPEAI